MGERLQHEIFTEVGDRDVGVVTLSQQAAQQFAQRTLAVVALGGNEKYRLIPRHQIPHHGAGNLP